MRERGLEPSGRRVTVRPIGTLAEYRACMALQQAAFGYEDLFVEPLPQLLTAQRYGGAVLGAFGADGRLLGYVYSCLGRRGEEPLHCFRLLAVAPDARGLGIGTRLLLALRDRACRAGIRSIVATFDPLEAANARLYLGKLGFRGRRYFPNHYGDLGPGQNAGLETDRLEIEWSPGGASEPDAEGVARTPPRPAPAELPPVATVAAGPGGWPTCTRLRLDLDARQLRLEIPPSLQALKAADPGLARAWRRWTRRAFLAYVGSGRYEAVDFRPAADEQTGPAYVLERVRGGS